IDVWYRPSRRRTGDEIDAVEGDELGIGRQHRIGRHGGRNDIVLAGGGAVGAGGDGGAVHADETFSVIMNKGNQRSSTVWLQRNHSCCK
ncbi:hypothetical protein B4Q13_16225, partial [Lacticaseibacillus rhamnosus]